MPFKSFRKNVIFHLNSSYLVINHHLKYFPMGLNINRLYHKTILAVCYSEIILKSQTTSKEPIFV